MAKDNGVHLVVPISSKWLASGTAAAAASALLLMMIEAPTFMVLRQYNLVQVQKDNTDPSSGSSLNCPPPANSIKQGLYLNTRANVYYVPQ